MDPALRSALPENLIALFCGANRFDNEKDACAGTLHACDEAGLLDWRTPGPYGHAFLTELSLRISSSLTADMLPRLVERHGTDLLTQAEADGTPAYQAVWAQHVKDKKDNKGTSYSYTRADKSHHADEQVMVAWVEQLPADQLSWLDEPGDEPGAGWMSAALRLDSNRVAAALEGRGISMSARTGGAPVALSVQSFDQWLGFLAAGGNPDETGWSKEFPELPLWEVLVRERGLSHVELMTKIAEWATENRKPGSEEAAYWHAMRQLGRSRGRNDNHDDLEQHLKSRPDWRTARDYWSRPALWVAARHAPRLWRLAAETRDKEGILQARDAFGHDVWFYVFNQMTHKTMTDKLWGLIASHVRHTSRPSPEGLVGQWMEDEDKTRRLLEGQSWWSQETYRDSEALRKRLPSRFHEMWGSDSGAQDATAEKLLASRSVSSQSLFQTTLAMLQKESSSSSLSYGQVRSSPWPQERLANWTPALRMATAVRMVFSAIVRNNAGEASPPAHLQEVLGALDDAGMAWPSTASPSLLQKRLEAAVATPKSANSSSSVSRMDADHPLVREWASRIEAHALEQDIGAAPAQPSVRRARM